MNFVRSAGLGKIAGAAGTVALDAATYADMALRGRPSSSAPSELVKKLAAAAGIAALTGDDATASNRRGGVGALLGYTNGVAIGGFYGTLRACGVRIPPLLAGFALGALAMAASDVPMVRTGATDPSTWGAAGWLSDIIPHAIYGLTTAYVFELIAVDG